MTIQLPQFWFENIWWDHWVQFPTTLFFKCKNTLIQRFLIILKEQGGMLFTDRLTFTQRTFTFNKLKLLLLMPSEYHLPQKAACFVPILQKCLDGHHWSPNGVKQWARENYFCSTNHASDTVQGKKKKKRQIWFLTSRSLQLIGQWHNTWAQSHVSHFFWITHSI